MTRHNSRLFISLPSSQTADLLARLIYYLLKSLDYLNETREVKTAEWVQSDGLQPCLKITTALIIAPICTFMHYICINVN